MTNALRLVPVVSSNAGACLTMAGFKAAGIEAISWRLQDLLTKPGLVFLHKIKSLQSFCGWQGRLVLNARLEKLTWRSPYDGGLIQITERQISDLIQHLAVDTLLFHQDSIETSLYFDEKGSFEDFLNLARNQSQPGGWLSGNFNSMQLKALLGSTQHQIETDSPAAAAMEGTVYTEEGDVRLKDEKMKDAHSQLAKGCGCRVCQQGFTRAYFHHLLEHCPLPCHRFLIEHNLYFLTQ